MAWARVAAADRHLYRVQEDVVRGRQRVRCYLVERPIGGYVVARIVSAGTTDAWAGSSDPGSRTKLGDWCPTPSASPALLPGDVVTQGAATR